MSGQAVSDPRASAPAASAPGAFRILVVDDDSTNRLLVRAVLSRSSEARVAAARVTEAATLDEAWARLRGDRPDAVVLDIRLPDGTGLDIARHIAGLAPSERPRVVIMSASVLAAQRDAATAAGCDAFLAKPFRPAELLELLGAWATAAGLATAPGAATSASSAGAATPASSAGG
ncbi:MAG TPA: response regulator [Candidatus Limnocylindrales bacterium]|jgi:CheY-like chemotaxis protein